MFSGDKYDHHSAIYFLLHERLTSQIPTAVSTSSPPSHQQTPVVATQQATVLDPNLDVAQQQQQQNGAAEENAKSLEQNQSLQHRRPSSIAEQVAIKGLLPHIQPENLQVIFQHLKITIRIEWTFFYVCYITQRHSKLFFFTGNIE